MGQRMAVTLMVASSSVFTLGVLNLIIAVLQKEYEDVESKAVLYFQRERARLCVQYMLQPSWRPSWWSRHTAQQARLSVLALVGVWAAIVYLPTNFLPARVVAACCLGAAEVLFASLCMRNEWSLNEFTV